MSKSKKTVLQMVIFTVVIAVAVTLVAVKTNKKSDAQMIFSRLDTWVASINDGDYKGMISCYCKKDRIPYQTLDSIDVGASFGSGLFGVEAGSDVGNIIAGLFSGGTKTGNAEMKLVISNLEFESKTKAFVTAEYQYSIKYFGTEGSTVRIPLIKEDGDWYICEG